MFEDLPSETSALQTLIADLHDDLHGRTERLRYLMALEYDFGGGGSLMIPGGTPAYLAYVEVRQAFVSGNFFSVVLLAQCLAENVLAAQIGMDAISATIHNRPAGEVRERPTFRQTVLEGRKSGLLDLDDERELLLLATRRNAIAHFRDVNDPTHLDRRAMQDKTHPAALCESDARSAVALLTRLLGKPAFRPSKPLKT